MEKEQFKTQVQDKYIEAVVDGLQDRFPNLPELEEFGIFDPQKCLSSQDELVDYGLGKLRLLQEKYGTGDDPDVDSEACVSEWESFKRLIQSYSSLNMTQMVTAMVTDSNLKDMYPELTKLATIAAILPVSTASCERAFSAMKRIKTELRNRMKTSTLDQLMRISIEGPPMDSFNFEMAAYGEQCTADVCLLGHLQHTGLQSNMYICL